MSCVSGWATGRYAALEHGPCGEGRALLANDAEVTFDVHDVTIMWDGKPRHIKADATGSTPLVGMLLLDRHSLNLEVERGGRVVIQPMS